jgi:hypothetical protein
MPESKILYESGHDDDGESWAGKRLQNVLNDTQAEGVVMVARWYGGQNIGPIRFTHIENCAKEAIWKWKVASTQIERDAASKKQKFDDEAQRTELVKNLQERDYNIFSLRKLLAEKKAELEEPYGKMGTDALKRVAKARDATIAFILKQIDKTEEELRLVQALEGDTQESRKDVEEQQRTEERKEPAAPTTPE